MVWDREQRVRYLAQSFSAWLFYHFLWALFLGLFLMLRVNLRVSWTFFVIQDFCVVDLAFREGTWSSIIWCNLSSKLSNERSLLVWWILEIYCFRTIHSDSIPSNKHFFYSNVFLVDFYIFKGCVGGLPPLISSKRHPVTFSNNSRNDDILWIVVPPGLFLWMEWLFAHPRKYQRA